MKNTTVKGYQIYFSPPYIMLLSSVKSSTSKIIILNDVSSDYPEDFTIIAEFFGGWFIFSVSRFTFDSALFGRDIV